MKSCTNQQIRHLTHEFQNLAEKSRNLRELDDLLELIIKAPPLRPRVTLFLVSALISLSMFLILSLLLGVDMIPHYGGKSAFIAGLLLFFSLIPINSYCLLLLESRRLSRTLAEKNLWFAQKISVSSSISSKWRKYERRFADFRRGCERRPRDFAWVGTKNLEKKEISLTYDLYEFQYLQRREKRFFDIHTRKWTNTSQVLSFVRSGIIFPLFPHKGNLVLGRHPIRSLEATPLPWRSSLPSSERVFNIWKDETEFSFLNTRLLKRLLLESKGLECLQLEVREGALLISTGSPLMMGKRSFGVEDGPKFQKELMSVRYLPELKQLEQLLLTMLEA